MATDDQKWYFNSETKEVSQGKKSSWLNRMGPYDSKEEAEHALERAHERNEEADEADEEWEDDTD
ncbi:MULTISPECIES: hypothetical protein [Corynebacterium]|uniref:hypothetical protein n=1 Tax=Corynebacterium TaxID=1716 RepID=UPI0026500922|nr:MULTISPECIES: hypothetical protein [Corynebacterium]MDN8625120.1 hypothetical protein [Corynebacterium kroppenstedtii]